MKYFLKFSLVLIAAFLCSCAYRLTVSTEDFKNAGRQIINGERPTFREARLVIINQSGADCYVDFDGTHYLCARGSKLVYSLPYAGFIGDNREIAINVVAVSTEYQNVRGAMKSWHLSGWRYQSNNETWILEYSNGALHFRKNSW